MSEAQSTLFGKYELLERLGTGGMAVVYRARYTAAPGVSRAVVIKRVLAHYAEDPAFAEMFLNEARISLGLSHGNIVQVFDFGQVDGEYFLAMELVDGQPLSRVLKRARARELPWLPAQIAVEIAIEMCRGLHHAHERTDEKGNPLGLVHRDISPDNVLVSYEGEVKISDFGIAKARMAGRQETDAGVVKGKYPYFSPEQARGQALDARSDVYAVGVVIYQMLCGRRPAEGSELDVMQRISEGRLIPLEGVNGRLDSRLVGIVRQALAINPDERFFTAEALQQALSDWMRLETPLFRSTARKHFMNWLFQEEQSSFGRAVRLPAEFLRAVDAWREALANPVTPVLQAGAPASETPRRQQLEMKSVPLPMRQTQGQQGAITAFPSVGQTGEKSLPEQVPQEEQEHPTSSGGQVLRSTNPAVAPSSSSWVVQVLKALAFGVGVAGLVSMGVFWLAVVRSDSQSHVKIYSEPAGAYVVIDGNIRGLTPMEVEPGPLNSSQHLTLVDGVGQYWTGTLPDTPDGVVDASLKPVAVQMPSTSTPGTNGALPLKRIEGSVRSVYSLPAGTLLGGEARLFRPESHARWVVLDPERTYTVWKARVESDFPVPALRMGSMSHSLMVFIEGVGGPHQATVQEVGSILQVASPAHALYFFFLGYKGVFAPDPGFDVVNVQDDLTKEIVSFGVSTELHSHETLPGIQFMVRNLDGKRRYVVDIEERSAANEGGVLLVALPEGRRTVRVSVRNFEGLVHVLGPGRYEVSGVRELGFALSRWSDGAGGKEAFAVSVDHVSDTQGETVDGGTHGESFPSMAKVAFRQGLDLLRRKQWQDAERQFSQCVEGDPYWARCHLELGRVSRRLGNKEQAMRHYSRYLELEPQGAWVAEASDFLGRR
jgi:serine/threonine-protein kinase